jgi:phosphohistidine phosphatase
MKLYLVRHGSYSSTNINISSPLSPEGRADITRLANYFAKMELSVPTIFHSSKLRAQQTAKILAEILNRGHCEFLAGLEPNDPIQPMLKMINLHTDDLLIVGHLPFMAKLTSQLLNVDEDIVLIDYQPGSAACLTNEQGQWNIRWVLDPADLPQS